MKAFITNKHRVLEILSYIILFISIILTAIYVINNGGEKIPVHYNVKGEADSWGNAANALMLPLVMLAVNILISLIGHLCPPKYINLPVKLNPENAAAVYKDTLTLLFLLGLELSVFCLLSSFCYLFDFSEQFGRTIFILLPVIFITILVEFILTVKHNNA